MIKFLKEYFFFQIGKGEKDSIRKRIMEHDHNAYSVLLAIIAGLQLIMLVASFFRYGFVFDNSAVNGYRILYLSLIVVCLVSFILSAFFKKQNKAFTYFVVVSLTMVCILLWCVGISVLDSLSGKMDIVCFAYTAIACALIIALEPWVVLINIGSSTALLICLCCLLPATKDFVTPGFYINVISVFLIAIIGCTFTFYRRIHSIRLEKKVNSLNQILEKRAHNDDLTNLYNRRYLTENINNQLNIGDSPSGVMLFDIDYFKNINDSFGHQFGDLCLSTIGSIVNNFIIDKEGGYCVRYGGEEFLIYIDHTNKEQILDYAKEIKKSIRETTLLTDNGYAVNMKISIGVALAKDNQSYANLINNADMSLYKAKVTRDTICFYDDVYSK